MRFEIKRRFKLKPSNKRYRQGDIFETDNELLAEQLKSLGFLGKRFPDSKPTLVRKEPVKREVEKEQLEESIEQPEDLQEEMEEDSEEEIEPVHVGGGWYLLSDGKKVRKSQLDYGD